MKTIDSFNFKDKRVLIRVDFNVPLNKDFKVIDTTRILSAKPSILKVVNDGGSCVLMSHLGRPEGREERFSLRHIVESVEKALERPVKFSNQCVGKDAMSISKNLNPGEILLLENLRFHQEEKLGDLNFAEQLSKHGDIYVNDAFGTAHRAHASTTTVVQFFPKRKCFGYLLSREIESIERVMKRGKKPVLAILGGAKVSSKISIIKHILDKVDDLIIGGGMAYTFIKAQGGSIGDSICESDKTGEAMSILKMAVQKGVRIHLPVDTVVADRFDNQAQTQIVDIDKIPSGWQGLDCGPKTIKHFTNVVLASQTILWNGPLGVFEMSSFSNGTKALGNAIALATKRGSFSLVGGGDSVAAVKQLDLEKQVSYVSTGGGAMLESLEGKVLPGIAAILDH